MSKDGTIDSAVRERTILAAERATLARQALMNCRLCAHDCRVNRMEGELGLCRAGPQARIFSAQVEVSDELDVIPTFAIAFSGCDLRCSFCITGKESWNPHAGQISNVQQLAKEATRALSAGSKSIMILGGEPTIHLPTVLDLVSSVPNEALLIWKTNAHGSADARVLLDGLFDIWIADYKFGNDQCATRLAQIPNYTAVIRENLAWAEQNSELIVRHLLMPGHLECCWRPVAEWLAQTLPKVRVNLRSGFWPAWQARKHLELGGPAGSVETKRAFQIAQDYDLHLIE
jgi:putative pyruvate formate lyase activating enzyme